MFPQPMWRLSLLVALGTCAGCGKSGTVQTAPVTGRITLDGEPLDGGTVTFVPDKQRRTMGPIGVGEIREDGTYSIVTDPGGDVLKGAVVGYHRIRITLSPNQRTALRKAKRDDKNQLPRKFLSEGTSGLNAEVRAGITNSINLDLKRPASQL